MRHPPIVDDTQVLGEEGARPFFTEQPNGRIRHRAEPAMLVLALLVIPAIVLEEASASWLRNVASTLNFAIWVGFAAELAFVLSVSRHRLRTLRAHWLDAAIVVVSFPLLGKALQSARALRLLRLLRFARLAFLGARAHRAARELFSPEGLRYVVLLVVLVVVVSGAAMAAVDSGNVHSVQDGVWWAVVTVTTVGYGDVVPHSTAGRALASVVMLCGIGFVALLTATVAATFVKEDRSKEDLSEKLDRLDERLERLERALLGGGERNRAS
jgi:voltage-gated potassium channel